jgi:hypothetical protein
MRNMPQNMRAFNNVFGPHMLRKFPPQTLFVKPNMVPQMPIPNMPNSQYGMSMFPQQMTPMPMEVFDKNTRRDYYGEKLYTKISSNPQFSSMSDYFSKIVGIFLDLEDPVIERLVNDDVYFGQQVYETVRVKYYF